MAIECFPDTYWYTLDSTNLTTSSCNGITLTNHTVLTTTGVFGTAGVFDGNDYLDNDTTAFFQEKYTSFTNSFWFRLDGTFSAANGTDQSIYQKGGGQVCQLESTDGKLTCRHNNGAAATSWLSTPQTSWVADAWYHIVYLDNGTGRQLWVNNSMVIDDGDSLPCDPNGDLDWAMGANYDGSTKYMIGNVDEWVWFGNKTLNSTEIGNMFNYDNVTGISGAAANCVPIVYDMHPYTAPDTSSPMDIIFNAYDGTSLDKIGVYIDGDFYNYTGLANNTNQTDLNFTWAGLGEGDINVISYCEGDNDVAVNSSTRVYHYDNKNPIIYWSTQSDELAKEDNSTSIAYSASYDLDIQTHNHHLQWTNITITHSNGTLWWTNKTTCAGACTWINYTQSITNLTVGTFGISVETTDTGVNSITEYGMFIITPIQTALNVGETDTLASQYMNKSVYAEYTLDGTTISDFILNDDNYLANAITDGFYGAATDGTLMYFARFAVADRDNITIWNSDGTYNSSITLAGGVIAPAMTYHDDSLYVLTTTQQVKKFSLAGALQTTYDISAKVAQGQGITYYDSRFYVLDSTSDDIEVYDTAFTYQTTITITSGTSHNALATDGDYLYSAMTNATDTYMMAHQFNGTLVYAEKDGDIVTPFGTMEDFISLGGYIYASRHGAVETIGEIEVTGSSAPITDGTCTADGNAMVYIPANTRFEYIFNETIADGSNHSVEFACSKTNFESQSATLTYGVDYWQTAGYATLSFPMYTDSFTTYTDTQTDGAEGDRPLTYIKCSPIKIEGSAVDVGDDVRLVGYFIGASAEERNFSIYPNLVATNTPVTSTLYASCNMTLPTGEGTAECQTSALASMAIGKPMWVCMYEPDYLGLHPIGNGNALFTGDSGTTWSILSGQIGLSFVVENTANTTVAVDEGDFLSGYVMMSNVANTPEVSAGITITMWQVNTDGTTNYTATDDTDANGYYQFDDLYDGLSTYISIEPYQIDSLGAKYNGLSKLIITTEWDAGLIRNLLIERIFEKDTFTSARITSNYFQEGFTLTDKNNEAELIAGNQIWKVRFDLMNITLNSKIDDWDLTPIITKSASCAFDDAVEWATPEVIHEENVYKLVGGGRGDENLLIRCQDNDEVIFTVANTTHDYEESFALTFSQAYMTHIPNGLYLTNVSQNLTDYTQLTYFADVFDAETPDWEKYGDIRDLECSGQLIDTTLALNVENTEAEVDGTEVTIEFDGVTLVSTHRYLVQMNCTADGYEDLNITTDGITANYAVLIGKCEVNGGNPIKPTAENPSTICSFEVASAFTSEEGLDLSDMRVAYKPAVNWVDMTFNKKEGDVYSYYASDSYKCGDGSQICNDGEHLRSVRLSDVPANVSYTEYFDYMMLIRDYSKEPVTITRHSADTVRIGDYYWFFVETAWDADYSVIDELKFNVAVDGVFRNSYECRLNNWDSIDFDEGMVEAYLESGEPYCRLFNFESKSKYFKSSLEISFNSSFISL